MALFADDSSDTSASEQHIDAAVPDPPTNIESAADTDGQSVSSPAATPTLATTSSLEALESVEQKTVLNVVDSLRQCGLDSLISLPQLVVCGDQSSGKSSVLEAITEIPFPRKENLCTRFATEIVLSRAQTPAIAIKIIPDETRTSKEQKELKQFNASITSFEALPSLIDRATEAMGISNEGSNVRAFARDVLRIEISGPHRPQLTLVDLPGLIHAENKSQTKADVELVADLVDTYIKKERTIILPVISAKNDYANQIILARARQAEKYEERTLGIITKPDDLPPGSESEAAFINLAQNKDIFFSLGWHVVKNRGFNERNYTFAQRNASEAKFFSQGAWTMLAADNVGITALRTRLSGVLFSHIRKELPKLKAELAGKLRETTKELEQLGPKRVTVAEQRDFLMDLSKDFYDIAKASVNGNYELEYFSKLEDILQSANKKTTRRLRAVIKYLDIQFAKVMRERGHKYEFAGFGFPSMSQEDGAPATPYYHSAATLLSKTKSLEWVQKHLARTRGRELVGNFNPLLVGELFWEQSEIWEQLAKDHAEDISNLCKNFVRNLLKELCPDDVYSRLLAVHIEDALGKRAEDARIELNKLVRDNKRFPNTYNHYFTITAEKIEKGRERQSLEECVKNSTTLKAFQKEPNLVEVIDKGNFWELYAKSVTLDSEEHSCIKALTYVFAYYKTALKTFTDNVPTQAIERHLIDNLEDIFSPTTVSRWSDEKILSLASEPGAIARQREILELKKKKLEEGSAVLRLV